MEEQILEMLNMKSYNLYMGFKERQQSAKEITIHVMEFTAWLIVQNEFHIQTAQEYEGRLSISPVDYINDDNDYSIEDIYQYWLTNVKR